MMDGEKITVLMVEPEQKPYVERPAWQVWLARIGLVVFLLFLVVYYFTMFSGGGR